VKNAKQNGQPASVHISDLRPDPENRRKHNPRNIGMVVDALHRVGAARSVVIDEQGVILAGNGVVEAAAEAGIHTVQIVESDGSSLIAVRRSGLSDAQKRDLAISDNRTAELAEWDAEQLAADLEAGLDLAPWFSEEELAGIVSTPVRAGLTDPDDVPDERPTDILAGDLFEMGRHRLICGDSTDTETVGRVLSCRTDLCFTSPPYGAGHVAKLRDHYEPGQVNRASFYREHTDNPDEWLSLMGAWFTTIRACVDAVICNVQLLADNKRALVEWVYALRDDLCDVMVWDKAHGAPQMQANVLSNTFEFLFIFGGNGTRSVPFANFHGTLQNLIRIDPRGQNEFSGVHRAVMPTDLPVWVLRELCPGARSVLDPFGGTGTTMMAAEQVGKSCRSIELDPQYCQVTIDRWESFTGQKAVKVGEAVRA
jgi:hypothetical protein